MIATLLQQERVQTRFRKSNFTGGREGGKVLVPTPERRLNHAAGHWQITSVLPHTPAANGSADSCPRFRFRMVARLVLVVMLSEINAVPGNGSRFQPSADCLLMIRTWTGFNEMWVRDWRPPAKKRWFISGADPGLFGPFLIYQPHSTCLGTNISVWDLFILSGTVLTSRYE